MFQPMWRRGKIRGILDIFKWGIRIEDEDKAESQQFA